MHASLVGARRLLGGLVALLILPALACGQDASQLINNDQEEQFRRAKFGFQQDILTGKKEAGKEQLEQAARYYVSRVTYVDARNDPGKMGGYVKEFEDMVKIASSDGNAAKNREQMAKFAPHLVQRFKEIFDLDFMANRVAIVNAATLLPHLAKLKQEEIADFLTALIDDPKKHDAIRVHAVRGIREYFPTKPFTKFETANKTNLDRKDRDVRRVDALIKFVERPMTPTSDAAEVGAFRYVRREAVESLAETQTPAVSAIDKGGKVEGPVAVPLMKILAKKTTPEPNLQERLEAAIGVCYFKARDVEEYDPRIGIFLVGDFLTDLVSEYKKDQINIQLPVKSRKPTYFAWKIESKRLEAALSELVRNTGNTAGAQAAQQLDAAARPILKAMGGYDGIEREQELRAVVEKLRPPEKTLFKDGKKPLIEFDLSQQAQGEQTSQ